MEKGAFVIHKIDGIPQPYYYQIVLVNAERGEIVVKVYNPITQQKEGELVTFNMTNARVVKKLPTPKQAEKGAKRARAAMLEELPEEAKKTAKAQEEERDQGIRVIVSDAQTIMNRELAKRVREDGEAWTLDSLEEFRSDCLAQIDGFPVPEPLTDPAMWAAALVSNEVWSALLQRDYCDVHLRMVAADGVTMHPWYVDFVNRNTPVVDKRVNVNVWKRVYEYVAHKHRSTILQGSMRSFKLTKLKDSRKRNIAGYNERDLLFQFEVGAYIVHVEFIAKTAADPTTVFVFFDRVMYDPNVSLFRLDTTSSVPLDAANFVYDDFGFYWTEDAPCRTKEPLYTSEATMKPENAEFIFSSMLCSVTFEGNDGAPVLQRQEIVWNALDTETYNDGFLRDMAFSPLENMYHQKVIQLRQAILDLQTQMDEADAVDPALFARQKEQRRELSEILEILGVVSDVTNDKVKKMYAERKKKKQQKEKEEEEEEESDGGEYVDDGGEEDDGVEDMELDEDEPAEKEEDKEEKGDVEFVTPYDEPATTHGPEFEKRQAEYLAQEFAPESPNTIVGIALNPSHICLTEAHGRVSVVIRRGINVSKREDRFELDPQAARIVRNFHVRCGTQTGGSGFVGWARTTSNGEGVYYMSAIDEPPAVANEAVKFVRLDLTEEEAGGPGFGFFFYEPPPLIYFLGNNRLVTFSLSAQSVPEEEDGDVPYADELLWYRIVKEGQGVQFVGRSGFFADATLGDTLFSVQHGQLWHLDSTKVEGKPVSIDAYKDAGEAPTETYDAELERETRGQPYEFNKLMVAFTGRVYVINGKRDQARADFFMSETPPVELIGARSIMK